MKKIFVFIILVGILCLPGCGPDRLSLGAMYLTTDIGPYEVDEVVPMVGLQWDLGKKDKRSPSSTSALTRAVSSDRGDLSSEKILQKAAKEQ